VLQQLDVLRRPRELVVAEDGAEGHATEGAVLVLVDLLEDGALVERVAAELVEQLGLRRVEDLDLQHRPRLGLPDEILQAAPRRFELLKFLMVHDRVDLHREQLVDALDALVDHGERVARRRHAAVEHLVDEPADEIAGALARRVVGAEAALLDDLVEEARGLRRLR
jgi:hypothetical protein